MRRSPVLEPRGSLDIVTMQDSHRNRIMELSIQSTRANYVLGSFANRYRYGLRGNQLEPIYLMPMRIGKKMLRARRQNFSMRSSKNWPVQKNYKQALESGMSVEEWVNSY